MKIRGGGGGGAGGEGEGDDGHPCMARRRHEIA